MKQSPADERPALGRQQHLLALERHTLNALQLDPQDCPEAGGIRWWAVLLCCRGPMLPDLLCQLLKRQLLSVRLHVHITCLTQFFLSLASRAQSRRQHDLVLQACVADNSCSQIGSPPCH